uniref:Putative secreted protein n=1 Tax=Anopheles triannulatus TaxID=58253 RepID=A0A2M4B2S4_9DIPT
MFFSLLLLIIQVDRSVSRSSSTSNFPSSFAIIRTISHTQTQHTRAPGLERGSGSHRREFVYRSVSASCVSVCAYVI